MGELVKRRATQAAGETPEEHCCRQKDEEFRREDM
jgi:hypothetical protein